MKAMKIKLTKEYTLQVVAKALARAGYEDVAECSNFFDATELYAYNNGLITKTTCESNVDNYFDNHDNPEHWLINGKFVDSSYFEYPQTDKIVVPKVNAESLEAVEGKLYAPLPLQPFSQWALDRMKLLAEHISHQLSKGQSVPYEQINELQDLNGLLKNSESDF